MEWCKKTYRQLICCNGYEAILHDLVLKIEQLTAADPKSIEEGLWDTNPNILYCLEKKSAVLPLTTSSGLLMEKIFYYFTKS